MAQPPAKYRVRSKFTNWVNRHNRAAPPQTKNETSSGSPKPPKCHLYNIARAVGPPPFANSEQPTLVSCSLLTCSQGASSLEIGYDICAQYPNGLQGRLPFVEGAPEQNVGDSRPFHVLQIFDAFGGAADD